MALVGAALSASAPDWPSANSASLAVGLGADEPQATFCEPDNRCLVAAPTCARVSLVRLATGSNSEPWPEKPLPCPAGRRSLISLASGFCLIASPLQDDSGGGGNNNDSTTPIARPCRLPRSWARWGHGTGRRGWHHDNSDTVLMITNTGLHLV